MPTSIKKYELIQIYIYIKPIRHYRFYTIIKCPIPINHDR